MTDQTFTAPNGALLGRIRTNDIGHQWLAAPNGSVLGVYRPESNATFDVNGHKIGNGNMLALLLPRQ